MCVTVVQWSRNCLLVQINRVRPPGDAFFCFFVPIFFLFGLCFNTFFSFWPFFFILTSDPAGHAHGSIYILSLSPECYFGKGISKALDLHTGQAYDQIKTISYIKTCPSSETVEFFSLGFPPKIIKRNLLLAFGI